MSPKKRMTREEEHEFYSRPENQEPQGPARRRRSRLTEMVPVRFPPETLAEVHRRADEDDRSVSSWIRRAVEHELERQSSGNVSNNLSNEPRRTGPDAAGRADAESGSDLHQHGRRRMRPDRPGRGSSDS
jgi:predicted transcriptional regulator